MRVASPVSVSGMLWGSKLECPYLFVCSTHKKILLITLFCTCKVGGIPVVKGMINSSHGRDVHYIFVNGCSLCLPGWTHVLLLLLYVLLSSSSYSTSSSSSSSKVRLLRELYPRTTRSVSSSTRLVVAWWWPCGVTVS